MSMRVQGLCSPESRNRSNLADGGIFGIMGYMIRSLDNSSPRGPFPIKFCAFTPL